MDHALPVCSAYSRADPAHHPHRTLDRKLSFAAQEIAQRSSFHKLHYDKRRRQLVVSLAEIVNRYHIWVMQHRGRTGLAPKSRQSGVVGHKLSHQDLDGNIVANAHASSAVNHAHSAFAE